MDKILRVRILLSGDDINLVKYYRKIWVKLNFVSLNLFEFFYCLCKDYLKV